MNLLDLKIMFLWSGFKQGRRRRTVIIKHLPSWAWERLAIKQNLTINIFHLNLNGLAISNVHKQLSILCVVRRFEPYTHTPFRSIICMNFIKSYLCCAQLCTVETRGNGQKVYTGTLEKNWFIGNHRKISFLLVNGKKTRKYYTFSAKLANFYQF